MCEILCSHKDEYEDYGLLGCVAVYRSKYIQTFLSKPSTRLHSVIPEIRNLNKFESILTDVCTLYAASLNTFVLNDLEDAVQTLTFSCSSVISITNLSGVCLLYMDKE